MLSGRQSQRDSKKKRMCATYFLSPPPILQNKRSRRTRKMTTGLRSTSRKYGKANTSRNVNNSTMRFWSTLFLVATTSLSLLRPANAQFDCNCAPSSFRYTFDFGLVCPPVNITRDGISDTFCNILPFESPGVVVSDLVPVRNSPPLRSGRVFVHVGTRDGSVH